MFQKLDDVEKKYEDLTKKNKWPWNNSCSNRMEKLYERARWFRANCFKISWI